ncbi:flagellar motor protein MotB [Burkholderia glumae]
MATDKAAEQAARKLGSGTIIVRRVKRDAHEGHHGGAWKIAYADFVTAMMAFFLLMWLLGSTSKYERQGIESYFNTPLSALLGGSADGSGTARSSVINGGGHDLSDTHGGNGNATQQAAPARSVPPDSANDARLALLKQQLTALVDENPKLKAFKNQIRLSTTREGLRIEIVDSRSRPMFATGSSRLEDYAYDILFQIGGVLNQVDNRVSLAGHTDAVPYSGGIAGYSNWELSSERANAARRALVAGHLREDKLLQVRGLADVLPFDRGVADAEVNRRISILVLNKEAERAFFSEAAEASASASRLVDLAAHQ